MTEPTTAAGLRLVDYLLSWIVTTDERRAGWPVQVAAIEAEAAAAARTALLDDLEAAVEGWRSVDHGLFSGAVVDGWLVHRGAVLREIKKLRRP